MLSGPVIITVALLYLCLLFAIAYYGDKRADQGRSLIANPTIYALSIAVYCTSWTFYGSVGRAASTGVDFLPIYLGPTLTFIVAWFVIRKIIRISKVNRTTSIADFIASRYGKSFQLGGLVTIIAVVGILPYISLQLKAISTSFSLLLHYPEIVMPSTSASTLFLQDTGLYVALIMALFAILFGTRHIDASEQHEGMVAAIAFESVVKLVAFLAVGLFVTFGLYGGFGEIFAQAEASGALSRLFTIDGVAGHTSWITLTLLAMGAIVVLPRQFQVLVVENVDERHLRKAMWLFPLYLLLINVFVLPIAFAGLLLFPGGGVDADTFVLTVPMKEQQPMLALMVFIGGLSAATGMIIVETIALATMVCNDLVMPLLLRVGRLHLSERRDLAGILLMIRRVTIILVVLLGYAYVRLIGESYALVTIGLVSFAAAMQFVPAIVGGIYWKGATKAGALAGLTGGFLVWIYTLLLPSFARSGWISQSFVENGPLGIALLKPYALFGLEGLDPISHATIWTMLVNVGLLVAVSLMTSQSVIERSQAVQFVDIFKRTAETARVWRGRATIGDLRQLLVRFIGEVRANAAFARFERESQRDLHDRGPADSDIVSYSERQLAGAIGAASARIMVASVLREEMHDIDRGPADPRRGLAAGGVFASARTEIARARGGDDRASSRQRAPQGARQVEGRFRRHGEPRGSHPADLDSLVQRNPARQPRSRSGAAPGVREYHRQGERETEPAHQRYSRPRQDGGGDVGVAYGGLGPTGGDRAGARRHRGPVRQGAPHLARDQDRRRSSANPGRCGSPHPGDRELDLERREILRPDGRPDRARSLAGCGLPPRRRQGQRHRHRQGRPAEDFRTLPAGRQYPHGQASGHRAWPADFQADFAAIRRRNLGRKRAGQGSDVLLPCSALSIGCAGGGSGRARSCARLIAYEQKLSRRSGWTAV